MSAPPTASEIAASRPPDSVTYTDWEWDPEDTDPPERREMVATVYSLFKVLRYEEEVRVHQRQCRKRIEQWHEPLRRELVEVSAPEGFDRAYDYAVTPAATVGRMELEYRRVWRLR